MNADTRKAVRERIRAIEPGGHAVITIESEAEPSYYNWSQRIIAICRSIDKYAATSRQYMTRRMSLQRGVFGIYVHRLPEGIG